MKIDQRIDKRRKVEYYMPVMDNNTHEILGYISDISARGFRLESEKTLTASKDYAMSLNQVSDISSSPYITLVARAVWVQPDPIIPNDYLGGFTIVSISQNEQKIFQRIVEIYGTPVD
jgi:hypothetical protein